MARPKSPDRFVPTTFSVPLSTLPRLERLANTYKSTAKPAIFGRDLLLRAIAAEEARLGLAPFPVEPLAPLAPSVPGSAAHHAMAPTLPVPPPPPPPPPPSVPGEGPWVPPPALVETYFDPPKGTTPDAVFDSLLPKALR